MADEITIDGLPAVVTPALTDRFAIDQGGVTKYETGSQVLSLVGSQDITLTNAKAMKVTTTLNDTFNWQAYDVDGAAYSTFMSLRSANTPRLLVGSPAGGTVVFTSFGGTFTIDGCTIGSLAACTMASTTINSSSIGLTTPAAAKFTTTALTDDTTISSGKAIKTGTSLGESFILQGYDVNNTVYRDFITIAANNIPSCSVAAPSGGSLSIDGAVLGGNAPVSVLQGTLAAIITQTGVSDGSSMGTGIIGEVISASTPSGSAVGLLSSGTIYDVNAIALTAGDWEIYGTIIFSGGIVTATFSQGWFGTAVGDVTTGRDLAKNTVSSSLASTAAGDLAISMPTFRVNITATTTYYLKATSTYTVGSPTAYGTIEARRVR